jgi:hypothetical protein
MDYLGLHDVVGVLVVWRVIIDVDWLHYGELLLLLLEDLRLGLDYGLHLWLLLLLVDGGNEVVHWSLINDDLLLRLDLLVIVQ